MALDLYAIHIAPQSQKRALSPLEALTRSERRKDGCHLYLTLVPTTTTLGSGCQGLALFQALATSASLQTPHHDPEKQTPTCVQHEYLLVFLFLAPRRCVTNGSILACALLPNNCLLSESVETVS